MAAQNRSRVKKRWIFLVAFLLLLHFYQLPYYYSQPGGALALENVVKVEDGYSEKGSFMLTTVQMGRANLLFYVWAKLSPYRSLFPIEQLRYEGESDEEYNHRQLLAMKSSQDSAKIVAYERAGMPVEYFPKGVLVTALIDGMPAKDMLQIGDHIVALEGETIETAEQLIERLQGKTAADTVQLTVRRDDTEKRFKIGFSPFPATFHAPADRVGIGVSAPITDRDIVFTPPVEIDTSQIGGPSAGLMFALEIYNQLMEEDLTKGYNIAGTGTINEEGRVGKIGGAGQKVVAADKAGADYFLAPDESGDAHSNYREALAVAKEIKTNMKVIPVDTFEDALAFLKTLPEK
ncbi:PDZ domain-containing protein [bacterium LRH843]|nr:PDZ domain-containing protein [bacterium LRH843]